jgi:hypothetical protein
MQAFKIDLLILPRVSGVMMCFAIHKFYLIFQITGFMTKNNTDSELTRDASPDSGFGDR